MIKAPTIKPNFSEHNIEVLKNYYEFNERYHEKLDEELRDSLREHPVFGPIISGRTPEQHKAESARSRELQRAAIFEGKWKEYSEDLISQGIMYARMNIHYSDWYDLIKMYKDFLIPHLKKDFPYAETTITFLDGLTKFLDYAMYGIAEAYFAEKNNIIVSREEQFRAIFENTADNISVVDKNMVIINMNHIDPSANLKKEDVIGKNILDFQTLPEERIELQSIIDRVFKTKTSLFFEISRIVNEERKYYSSSLSPIFNSKGEVENIIFVSRDITTQKTAEVELKNMNAILERKVLERTEELRMANEELKKKNIELQRK